jgi:tetratricopeptide (TPR) repeat protein
MQLGDWRAATERTGRLVAAYPRFAAGWYLASVVAMRGRRAGEALTSIDRALKIEPSSARFHLQRAQCLAALSRWPDALEAAGIARKHAPSDPSILDGVGTLCSYANDQRRALAAYDQAVSLAPNNPGFLFNRAAVRRFIGDLAGAESDYDRAISLKPDDYEAYKNRSDLRPQTRDRNHTSELEGLLTRLESSPRAQVLIRFALSKEYEDLGDFAKSWEHLLHGARLRRNLLQYDVSIDVATVDWIVSAFARRSQRPTPVAEGEEPIFIVGLPRSGSTLVDRILSSHSKVFSAGELNHFALAVVDAVRTQSPSAQLTRKDLIERSTTIDAAALGKDYLSRTRPATGHTAHFTDKMPLNYLYCGLIDRALPGAKIVHVRRHPMASCYAMFKTLFKDGYPFSYDLTDIARYYIAYRRLMNHWQATLAGKIYDLGYEQLIADPLGETRRLLAFCGLDWEDACAVPHRNVAPTTTASAAQVRRPIYDSSVSQWRHYEAQLLDLKKQLMAAGIAIDDAR